MFGDKAKWPRIPCEEYRLRIDRAKQVLATHGIENLTRYLSHDLWIVS